MVNTTTGQVQGAHARCLEEGSGKDPRWRGRLEKDISSRTNDRDKEVKEGMVISK